MGLREVWGWFRAWFVKGIALGASRYFLLGGVRYAEVLSLGFGGLGLRA